MTFRWESLVLFSFAFVYSTGGAADLSTEDLHFFENKIRPALVTHCYECHSEEAGKRKGGLWLDRKEGWQLGGDTGPAAIPGDVDGSLFIETIRYEDPDLEMPPDGKLPEAVVADFEEWVRRGLPDPRVGEAKSESDGMSIEEGRKFWSYRPRVTEFGDRESIDHFIEEKLEGAGVSALEAAEPLRVLRRARVDLTGLMPTIEEQDEFLADPSEEKWAELIDRWLDSPEFGERWGRHWLDIARYADSSGGGRAMPFFDAWRFRDFVIDSFTQDRPLDELIRLHLAGDLLPYGDLAERQENLIATGFLALGPHNYENQNKAELDFEIIDEQLDTLGKAFMGQTLGCARCHDHKFDPVPTKDYYAMAGILMSTHSVKHSNVSKWHEEPVPPTEEAKMAIEKYEKSKGKLESQVKSLKDQLAKMGVGSGGMAKSVSASSLPGIVVDDSDAKWVGEWERSTHSGRWINDGYMHDMNSSAADKSMRFEAIIPDAGSYELRVSYSSGPNRNTGVAYEVKTKVGETSFTVNQRLVPEHDQLFETLGEFDLEEGELAVVTLRNGGNRDGHVIADAIQWLPVEDRKPVNPKLATETVALNEELKEAEKELKALSKGAPKMPRAMSVIDKPTEAIGGVELRIRGMESNRGDKVPRGFLEVATWEVTPLPGDQSGRLELANWLVDERHPLTARVLANRIWLKLMGEGLVRTPDNFGVTGEEPTHPALLDFLAGRLIDSGWSTKALVREIVFSDVYRRDTGQVTPEMEEVDPENKLYARAHLRPVPVESLRDKMLTLSGELDETRGGPSLPEGFRSEFGYEFTTMRRSVYVPIFRNSGYEMFGTFDFANPNFTVGKRSRSTIPTQALFLTNSELVHEFSTKAAKRLLEGTQGSDEDRIVALFRESVGRPPSLSEKTLAIEFLRESGDTEALDSVEAWAALQRAVFGSVDFRYLR